MEEDSQNSHDNVPESMETQYENSYGTYGCHDVETFSSDDDEEEETSSEEYTKKILFHAKHLEWHCAIYREALGKVTNGRELVEESKEKFLEANDKEENCQSCKIEELQTKIAQLEAQLQKNNSVQKWISDNSAKKHS